MTAPVSGVARPGASGRVAALDGLRGFALLGMLAWHAEMTWVRGGFARMTIFFVLAGFLAGSSLRRAYQREEPRPFRTFWGRRARRLLPVTMLGVAWAIAVTALVGAPRARETVVGDALSTMGSVANWRFIADDRPYGAMLEQGTAFQHYWSLSLEEQAFLALPIILAVVAWCARGRDSVRLWLLGALAVFFASLPAWISHAPDTAYYGTHVRMGEFLAGVLLAEIVALWPVERAGESTRRTVGVAGTAGLVLLVATMLFVDRENQWLYEGGLGLFAIPTVAVLAAILTRSTVVTAVLAITPLVVLGRWALSIYVLHWPLYQLMDEGRIGLDGPALQIAQVAAGIVVGGLAFVFIEQPLLRAMRVSSAPVEPVAETPRWSLRLRSGAAAVSSVLSNRPSLALGVTVVVLSAAAFAVPQRSPEIDFAAAEAARGDAMSPEEARALLEARAERDDEDDEALYSLEEALDVLLTFDAPAYPVVREPGTVVIAVFGGSAALSFELGTAMWAEQNPNVHPMPGSAGLGCGLLTDGERRQRTGEHFDPGAGFEAPPEPCLHWEQVWPATVVVHEVDVPVVVSSTWDVEDWYLAGDATRRGPGDPVFDTLLAEKMGLAVDLLVAGGASEVVWVTPPPEPQMYSGNLAAEYQRRADIYVVLLEQMAAERSDVVRIVDFRSWAADLDTDERRELLPDGVHATNESAATLWTDFFGPAIEQVSTMVPAP